MLYTSFSIVGMIFTAALLPETKGKKLEDLEQLFKRSTTKTWQSDCLKFQTSDFWKKFVINMASTGQIK